MQAGQPCKFVPKLQKCMVIFPGKRARPWQRPWQGQLQPERAELIAPVDQAFEARPGIWVRPPLQASSSEGL